MTSTCAFLPSYGASFHLLAGDVGVFICLRNPSLTRLRMKNATSPTRPSIADLVVAGQDRCGLRPGRGGEAGPCMHHRRAQPIYFLRALCMYASLRCVIQTSVNPDHLRDSVQFWYSATYARSGSSRFSVTPYVSFVTACNPTLCSYMLGDSAAAFV